MRCLLTGAHGLLAHDIKASWGSRGHDVVTLARADLDITCVDAVADRLDDTFDVVVNSAAWTAVDDAEEHEAAAFAVNAVGAAILARAAQRVGARLVHFSTDYVFDGSATAPYAADAAVAPATAYGRTKAAGEWAVRAEAPDSLILRTAWLYGAAGPCFPRTMRRLATERGNVSVVDDQWGQPTWTRDVADLAERLITADVAGGIYHATSAGSGTWCDFAREILHDLGPGAVTPVGSDAYPRPAARPAYSVLSHDTVHRAGVTPIGDWRERWAAARDYVS